MTVGVTVDLRDDRSESGCKRLFLEVRLLEEVHIHRNIPQAKGLALVQVLRLAVLAE